MSITVEAKRVQSTRFPNGGVSSECIIFDHEFIITTAEIKEWCADTGFGIYVNDMTGVDNVMFEEVRVTFGDDYEFSLFKMKFGMS